MLLLKSWLGFYRARRYRNSKIYPRNNKKAKKSQFCLKSNLMFTIKTENYYKKNV